MNVFPLIYTPFFETAIYCFGYCLVVDVFSRTSAWGPGLELLAVGPMLTVLKDQVKQEIPDFVEN
jgi:hypothetical protein